MRRRGFLNTIVMSALGLWASRFGLGPTTSQERPEAEVEYQYKFDGQGRLSSVSVSRRGSEVLQVHTYEYDDSVTAEC